MLSNELASQPGSPAPFSNPDASSAPPAAGAYLEFLDNILRRREDFFAAVFANDNLRVRMRMFVLTIAALAFVYGATMGASGFVVGLERGLQQMLASGVKVPALYLLTVAICFPVLFIVLVLMGSRLSFSQTLSLILLALTLNSILLAAFAPIVFFFIITGASYEFIKVLIVGVMGFSGCWAMGALWQGLREMCEKSNLYPKQAIRIMQIWILVFGFVGTQMAWSLRPFVGSRDQAFQVFRADKEGNFYKATAESLTQLFRKTKNARDARD